LYSTFKKAIFILFPRKQILLYEQFIRKCVYFFYKGKKHECNLCQAQLSRFITLSNQDLLCPKCGSLPRTRRLFQILKEKNLLNGKILHFSPPKSLHSKLKTLPLEYISSDFESEFEAMEQYDLTAIPLPPGQFDLVIAYHVLEHIEADKTAMKEIYRILKKGGFAIIQTPFKKGNIYENPTIKTVEERLQHFGQKDHVRIYSVVGLAERLKKVGFNVEILSYGPSLENKCGFKMDETVLLCGK
jgi:SAM-dependent methyltransferase